MVLSLYHEHFVYSSDGALSPYSFKRVNDLLFLACFTTAVSKRISTNFVLGQIA